MADAKLNFYINPLQAAQALSAQEIGQYGTQAGYIAFDEKTHLLYVHGQAYGLSDSQASLLANLATSLGTLEGVIELPEDQEATVENVLKAIDAKIDANAQAAAQAVAQAAQAAQAAQETADSKIASVTGETGDNALINASTSAQAVSISATQKLQQAIAAAETAIQSVITNGVTYTVQDGTAQGTIAGTNITVGSIQGAQGTHDFSNNSIAYAIDQLDYAINTLSGESGLTGVLEEIRAIKKELETEGTTGDDTLSTLIDALRKLQVKTTPFVGIKADGTVGVSGEEVALQTSLGNIVSYAGGQAQGAKEYAYAQSQGAKEYAYAQSQGAKTYAGGLINDLDSTQSIQGTSENGWLSLSVVEENGLITSVQGSIDGTKYDPAGAASTAQSNAQTYAASQAAMVIGSSTDNKDADTVYGAKKYADSVAASNAASVISWTILGENSGSGE